jgi:hypothetical protein
MLCQNKLELKRSSIQSIAKAFAVIQNREIPVNRTRAAPTHKTGALSCATPGKLYYAESKKLNPQNRKAPPHKTGALHRKEPEQHAR